MVKLNLGEKKRKVVLPGDKLASIEEFVPGAGTATVGDSIISTVTGGKQADMTNRVMIVESIKT
ncbi:MAG: hypothetical protein JRN67_08805, partial [Nitrososphaerota archaeon]|nr:hypothetical protein [Nitrososphaerota archaeon]